METKFCNRCGQAKPSDQFYTSQPTRCMTCSKEVSIEWRKKNPERWRARRQLIEQTTKRKISRKASRLRTRYGLAQADVERLLEVQSGRCAICKTFSSLGVDHNHETGYVRGFLCNSCNLAIALLKDDKELVKSLYNYLKNPPADQINLRIKPSDPQGVR